MEANMDTQLVKAVTVEMATGREMQEVKAMVFMAKQYPRDEEQAITKILKACKNGKLAEEAAYEFPRGREMAIGPSIRLAEAIAQNWGNVDFGITELEQKDGESVILARAWDLETNTRSSKIFTVPHIRHTRNGDYKLTDPRDIYEMVANSGARRERSCILAIIPGHVTDTALEQCDKTLMESLGGNLLEAIEKMFVSFESEYGITQAMIEKYLGFNRDAFTSRAVIRMRRVFLSLKHNMAQPSDYFEGAPRQKPQGKSGATGLDQQLKQGQKNAPAQ